MPRRSSPAGVAAPMGIGQDPLMEREAGKEVWLELSPPKRSNPAVRFDYGFPCNLLGRAAALGEVALGPAATAAYMNALGLLAGAEVEEFYRKRWDVWVPLTPAKYGYMIAELYDRMGGGASLAGADAEKVVIGVTRCPFADSMPAAPSLCLLTHSLFGSIAVRNFGYARVVHRSHVAARDRGCEIAVYLKRTPEGESEEGREYAPGSPLFGGDRGGQAGAAQRIALAGRELREKLLGLDTPLDRSRLLAEAGGLFRPAGTVEELHRRIALLGSGELGEACALYLDSHDDPGRSEVAAVHHADPSVAQALRQLLSGDPRERLGEIGKALSEGRPLLAPDVGDGSLALPRDAVQTLSSMGLSSVLVVPLVVETRRLGSLVCVGGSQRRLDARDLLLAVRFAGLVSAAIETAGRHRQLAEALNAREAFTSMAFHELQNALARLKALAQVSVRVLEKGKPEGVSRVERNLEAMSQHVDLLAGLIRDMSDAFSIATTRMDLRRERTNLNSLVASVVERFEGIGGEHSKYRLRVEVPAVQLIGMWDRTRIEQLLTNLLANAVNYSPNGGLVTVRVRRAEPAELETEAGPGGKSSTKREPTMAVVTVRDQGIGIPADQHVSVFSPFCKASNVGESHREGAGLGLYICAGIVEAHGGRIWVDSQVGRGSAFHFSLPLEETALG